jgi:hypothetical protein
MYVTVEDCLASILATVDAYVEPSHCGVFCFYQGFVFCQQLVNSVQV